MRPQVNMGILAEARKTRFEVRLGQNYRNQILIIQLHIGKVMDKEENVVYIYYGIVHDCDNCGDCYNCEFCQESIQVNSKE